MNRITKFNKILVATSMLAMASYSSLAFSQTTAIACPGYVQPKSKLLGERTGKRMQAAYEVYLNEELDEKARVAETITLLREIEAKEEFDKASVERFLGQLLISEDGKANEALELIETAAARSILNDKDQADLMKLVADLSLQQEQYANAIKWYNKYMDFTCKEDGDTWTKVAQANALTKNNDEAIKAADKAIALYEKPNKNPYNIKLGVFYEQKNFKGSVSVGEILVSVFPDEKVYWSQLGFFYMLIEDYTNALATFELAETLGFLSKKSEYRSMAQLYGAMDIPYKSARLQEKHMASGLLDNEANNLAALANSFRQARDYKESAKYYGQAGQKDPAEDYFERQGAMLLDAEDYKGAIAALTKSLETSEDDKGNTHYALMQAYFYDGDFRKSHVHAVEAMKNPTLRRSASAWLPYIKGKAENRGIKI